MAVISLDIVPRDAAIRSCNWPLIRFAWCRVTHRRGLIIGRRRAARHGWDLRLAWRGGGRDWVPVTDLKLEEPGDHALFAAIIGGRA